MPATLLLADDSVTIQRVIELTFANEDVRVIATSDGEAAVQRIDAEPPDIILADVGMPKLDGYEVASHVKRTPALKKIPVLLLTGAFEPIDEERARASGCDGILVKPIEPQQLVGRVKELLAGQRSPALWPEHMPRVEPRPAPRPVTAPPPAPERILPPPAAAPVVVAPPVAAAPDQPAGEEIFQWEFDKLDAAFDSLDPNTARTPLDERTASEFANDLNQFRTDPATAVT